ncbi:MAG: hypothetical protein PHQ46_14125, partial [Negativicutes bacterium]|nr:hypothetical protein [Negativicutes bacterium]
MLQYREKQYRIEDVLPGMTLGEDIGHNSGKSILNQGAVLTEKLIQRLENWHIAHVVIREVVEPTKENRSQALEKQKDFKHNYGETVQIIKQIFDSTKACKDIPIKDLRELAQTKVKPFLNESGLLNNLYLIERNDNYLYQ